jgi:hypothetical protein
VEPSTQRIAPLSAQFEALKYIHLNRRLHANGPWDVGEIIASCRPPSCVRPNYITQGFAINLV